MCVDTCTVGAQRLDAGRTCPKNRHGASRPLVVQEDSSDDEDQPLHRPRHSTATDLLGLVRTVVSPLRAADTPLRGGNGLTTEPAGPEGDSLGPGGGNSLGPGGGDSLGPVPVVAGPSRVRTSTVPDPAHAETNAKSSRAGRKLLPVQMHSDGFDDARRKICQVLAMCMDMCADICIQMCIDMRLDMSIHAGWMDDHNGHGYRHVHRHAYEHVNTHEYRHVYGYMCV